MNRAGSTIKNLTGDAAYPSFRPAALPPRPELVIDDEMLRLLVEANRGLAKLDTLANSIPNMDLFVSMYVRKEALISSQIEGTQCTLDDVLDPDQDKNMNLDVAEIVNYVKATQFALDRLSSLPLCNRLLREVHAILMQGVRGQEKNPGEFRHSQNWIGAENCSLKTARFIPPNPADMEEAMSALEKFINESKDYDALIRAALIHYQFETVHPFLDGNGRIGRLLILLYLMTQRLLTKPVLYVSYFLKKNQVEYYDRIHEVRRQGNYEQWIRFFLEAVEAAAMDAVDLIAMLTELHDRNLSLLSTTPARTARLRKFFDYVEQYPITDIRHVSTALQLSYNTAAKGIQGLAELGILKERTNAARNRVFAYEEYLNILRRDT